MIPNQSAITQWGWGFHTLRDGVDPGDLRLRHRVVFNMNMRPYRLRVWRHLDVVLRGNSRRTLAP